MTKPMTAVIAVLMAGMAFAEPRTVVWSGGGTGGWSDPANWESDPPVAGDTAEIPTGKTATLAAAADFKLANSLAEIKLSAADAKLLVANTAYANLSVRVTGTGLFWVENNAQNLDLTGDNTGFTGPFTFVGSQVYVRNNKALGVSNVVTNSPKTNGRLEIDKAGMYGNTLYLNSSGSNTANDYYCEADNVTNTGPVYVTGAARILGPAGFSGFGFVTFAGGFSHKGAGYARIIKKVRLIGDTPCVFGSTENYNRGGIMAMESAVLEIGAPVSITGLKRIASFDGTVRFIKENVMPSLADGQTDRGTLAFGNASASDTKGGTIDLNGCSQTIWDFAKDPSNPTGAQILTSATPATLTVCGTFYRYGDYNWKNNESKNADIQLEGAVSYELNSKQTGWSGRWQQGHGHTYFTKRTSTTTGFLSVKCGTLSLGADTTWTKLSELRVSGSSASLIVNTSAVNPGRVIVKIGSTGTLTLGTGVLLDARKAVVGDTYLEPGVYGGPDAGLDAAHTLASLKGTGLLKVRLPEHPGLMLLFK